MSRFLGSVRSRLPRRFGSRPGSQAGLTGHALPGRAEAITPGADGFGGQMPRRGASGEVPVPEPKTLAPERAIVLAMNRTPPVSRIDLPLVPVERVEAALPALAQSGIPPRAAPNSGQAAPVIVPQRQPDGKGAPLPRNRKRFRRRLIASILAAIMILVSSGITAAWLLRPAKDPTLVSPTQLGPFPSGNGLVASNLPLQPNQTEADQINNLPPPTSQAATLVKQPFATLATRALTLNGLGQAQMGIQTPMDVSVAANAQYEVEAVDGGFLIANIRGETRSIGFVQFFSPVSHAGAVFGEPRVIFDPTGQQWVLVVNEVMVNNGNVSASYFDVGISTTSSPLEPWHVYQIPTQAGEVNNCNWADDPQVGSNVSGFFIAGSLFNCGAGGLPPVSSALWELPRATYGKGKSEPPLRWVGFSINADRPLLSVVPAVEAGPTETEWLIADEAGYVDDGSTSQVLSLWAIGQKSTPGAASGLPHKIIKLPTPYADPPQAQQPAPAQANQPSPKLLTGDARIASAQFINGHLYTAFTTAVNWAGDQNTRSGIYWLDLVPSFSSPTASVSVERRQAGILGQPGTYLFMPALVADAQGDLVLSAQISSASIPPGTIYASRRGDDPKSQMGQGNTMVLIQPGTKPFDQAEWGDYTGGGLVIYNSQEVYAKVWIAAPIVDPGAPGDQLASSWHTSLWEFDTGGSLIQNIE